MANETNSINVLLRLITDEFDKGIVNAEVKASSFVGNVSKMFRSMGNPFSNFTKILSNRNLGAPQMALPVQSEETKSIADQLVSGMESAYAKISSIGKGIESVFHGIGTAAKAFGRLTPFKNIQTSLTSLKKPLKDFGRAFKRILLYKSIRGGIGLIIQGWKEGFTNLYGYSQRFGTQFHSTMDSLATDMQYLHNGMAAMVAPLVNAVAPAIEAIAARVVDLANAIGYFFAKILGQSSFSAAIRGSKAFQDLGGSAKEAKKQLMGFDELNVLTEPSSGGAAGADYGKMFEEWSTELEEGSIEQRIRDAIEKGDWEGLGSLFAEKLNGIVNQFGEGSFGTTVGKKIQKGLSIAKGFMSNFSFSGAGAAIAKNINKIVSEVSWKDLGDLLASGVTSAFDFVIGFVDELDTGELAASIGDVVKGWFNHFTEWIGDVNWDEIGTTFFNKVYDFVTGIDFAGTAQSFFTFMGTALNAGLTFLQSLWDNAMAKINEYLGIDADDSGLEVIGKFLNGIWKGMVGIVQWVYDNVVKPFFDALRGKKGLGLDEGENGMEQAGEDAMDSFFEGLKGIWPKITEWLSNVGKSLKETFTNWQAESKRASEMNYTPTFNAPTGNDQLTTGGKTLRFKANGGDVPTGDLFIAGEAGPELVGTVNGRTTVTNQEQFTAGMWDVMDNTNSVILQAAQTLVQAIQSKPVPSFQIGDRDIVSAYDRGKTLAGSALVE